MMVPGSNLLRRAMKLIAPQRITYLAWASRTKTSTGTLVSNYAAPRTILGSTQPVPRSLMEILGLDMQRTYFNVFVPQAVIDIGRDVGSDQFKFAGKTFQGVSSTPWAAVDGWTQILVVMVPDV